MIVLTYCLFSGGDSQSKLRNQCTHTRTSPKDQYFFRKNYQCSPGSSLQQSQAFLLLTLSTVYQRLRIACLRWRNGDGPVKNTLTFNVSLVGGPWFLRGWPMMLLKKRNCWRKTFAKRWRSELPEGKIDIHEREGDQAPPKWKENIFQPDSLFKGKLLAVFGYVYV